MTIQDLLNPDFRHYSTQINKSVKKGIVTVVTSYVSIIKFYPKKLVQGTKYTVKVDKNYHAKYQYTIYFDNNDKEVTKKEFYTTK